MTEFPQEKFLIFTADDIITEAELRAVEAAREVLPELHGSIIVTAAEAFLRENRDRLIQLDPGVHIDLFEHPIPNDPAGLFGRDGKLLQMLHDREHGKSSGEVPEEWRPLITTEMTRQIQTLEDRLGVKSSHISYHFGMHHFQEIIEAYADLAHQHDLPFRWAKKYEPGVTPPSPLHPHGFVDEFNLKDSPETCDILGEAKRTLPNGGGFAEVCLHLGQNTRSSQAQAKLFSQIGLRREIEAAGFKIGRWSELRATRGNMNGASLPNRLQ